MTDTPSFNMTVEFIEKLKNKKDDYTPQRLFFAGTQEEIEICKKEYVFGTDRVDYYELPKFCTDRREIPRANLRETLEKTIGIKLITIPRTSV